MRFIQVIIQLQQKLAYATEANMVLAQRVVQLYRENCAMRNYIASLQKCDEDNIITVEYEMVKPYTIEEKLDMVLPAIPRG